LDVADRSLGRIDADEMRPLRGVGPRAAPTRITVSSADEFGSATASR